MNKKIWLPKLNYYSKRLSMWQEKLWKEVNGKPFMGILDNIAGRKTFEYATFGRSGVQQSNSKLFGMRKERTSIIQKMTAACVWNASNAAGPPGPALETQIDRGTAVYDTVQTGTSSSIDYNAYGYSVISEHYLASAFGSIGTMDDSTYLDGGGIITRTIKGVIYTEPGFGSPSDNFILSIDGTNVTNADSIWLDITWDDIAGTPRTLTRATDATTYTASLNGSTHWRDTAAPYSWDDLDANTDFVLTTS